MIRRGLEAERATEVLLATVEAFATQPVAAALSGPKERRLAAAQRDGITVDKARVKLMAVRR